MIETQTLKGEHSSQLLKSSPDMQDLDLDQLATVIIEFYQKINLIRQNFKGPDYFGLEGNFTDLQALLIRMAEELRFFSSDSSSDSVWLAQNFPGKITHKFMEPSNTDAERISLIVAGLEEVIQFYQNISLKRPKEESFFNKDPFRQTLGELENILWIFTMFSKY